MKVILINHYKAGFPFIDELAKNLQNKSLEVTIIDIIDMVSVCYQGDQKVVKKHLDNSLLVKALKVPYIGTFIKKQYYDWYFEKNEIFSDHLSLHFISPVYTSFIPLFERRTKAVSAVIWGSDFYRASESNLNLLRDIFNRCNDIVIANTKMAGDFLNFYDSYADKIRPVGFGISKLDLIKKISSEQDVNSLKKELSIPTDKLIVTVGYNGIRAQQHLLILKALSSIQPSSRKNIFILVPFGYGGHAGYKSEIQAALDELGVGYNIYDSFLSDSDVAKIRLSTDLVINAQISDASSASIQEHLFAGNVLLAGEWLPYEYFTDHNIKFWKFSVNDLHVHLENVLSNFEKYKVEVLENRNKVYDLSSWSARIDQWAEVYSNSFVKNDSK